LSYFYLLSVDTARNYTGRRGKVIDTELTADVLNIFENQHRLSNLWRTSPDYLHYIVLKNNPFARCFILTVSFNRAYYARQVEESGLKWGH
jgi:hypothetical protein